eukprot:GHVU01069739.1.p1 GENE.GHVU01069739.1~~GHVU01069739.1.p1  ORF type:complete len:489 (-),score=38.53 GHVU01069739.1:164-1630(-)
MDLDLSMDLVPGYGLGRGANGRLAGRVATGTCGHTCTAWVSGSNFPNYFFKNIYYSISLIVISHLIMLPHVMRMISMMNDDAEEEEAFIASTVANNNRNLVQQQPPPPGGSVPGRRYYHRDREGGEARYRAMYWGENPRYDDDIFTRRHRIPRALMQLIHDDLQAAGLLQQSRDSTGRLGVSVLLQIAIGLRVLGKGFAYDSFDEIFDVAESTVCAIAMKFVRAIVHHYCDQYLRAPNNDELNDLLRQSEARGFPGCWGSIDGCPWEWDNCPVDERGSYKGRHDRPSIVLEAIADGNLRIWHAFFGVPGVNNDIAVLERSPFFNFYTSANSCMRRPVRLLGGHELDSLYVLGDGIYSHIAVIAAPIAGAATLQERFYNQRQSAQRKDVERTFGVMKARWWILRYPSRYMSPGYMHDIMYACIILHNMIIAFQQGRPFTVPLPPEPESDSWPEHVRLRCHYHRAGGGATLRLALAAHLWQWRQLRRQQL